MGAPVERYYVVVSLGDAPLFAVVALRLDLAKLLARSALTDAPGGSWGEVVDRKGEHAAVRYMLDTDGVVRKVEGEA